MTATAGPAPTREADSPAPGARRPTAAGWAARGLVVAGLAAAALAYVSSTAPVHADILANAVITAIGALSINVLVGYAGQISLGHQAFVGIGAFTSAYVISQGGSSFYVGLAAGAAVGTAQAVALGLIALRVRGLYFALITLVWGFVGENSIFRLEWFTGGGAGQDAPRPQGFTTDRAYLLLCALVLAVILLVDWRMLATKAGRAMQALRESDEVAASYGVSVRSYTLLAFAVAGFYAGVAGALYASRRTNVVAEDFTFLLIALPYLVVAVVGGLRHRGGIVVFALLYALTDDWLPDVARNLGIGAIERNASLWVQAFGGLLAIATLVRQPNGVGTITEPIGRWLKGGPPAPGAHTRRGRDGHGHP